MTIQEFEKLIEKHDLTEHKGYLVNQFRPAIEMLPYKGETKLGGSRFGGMPDLPSGATWPAYNDIPYVFVGQINFEELPDNEILPKTGLLSIFASYVDDPGEEERPELFDEGGIHLIYTKDTDALAALNIPEGAKLIPATPINFSLTGDIGYNIWMESHYEDDDEDELKDKHHALRRALHPNIRSPYFDLTSSNTSAYNEYFKILENKRHQLLGYYESHQLDNIDPCDEAYIPLIILDSCYVLGWEWGDCEMICISVEKDKLKEADFSSIDVYHD